MRISKAQFPEPTNFAMNEITYVLSPYQILIKLMLLHYAVSMISAICHFFEFVLFSLVHCHQSTLQQDELLVAVLDTE